MRVCETESNKKMHRKTKEKKWWYHRINWWKSLVNSSYYCAWPSWVHKRAWYLQQPLCTSFQMQSYGMAILFLMQVFNGLLPCGLVIDLLILAAILLPSSTNRYSIELRLGIRASTAGLQALIVPAGSWLLGLQCEVLIFLGNGQLWMGLHEQHTHLLQKTVSAQMWW